MNDAQMRAALKRLYPTKTWAEKLKTMSEPQVFAIYSRHKSLGNV